MPSIRVLSCAALAVFSAACQTAEFEKTKPEAVVVSLSAGVISADDGTLRVTASAVQDGVALLEEDVTVTIGGVCVAPPQTIATGVASGVAEFTFTNLTTAGACTATATVRGDVTATSSFSVVGGEPATLTLTDETSTTILAGDDVRYSSLVEDAAGNDLALGVSISVDSDSATLFTDIDGTTHITFTETGDYTVTAQIYDLTDSFDVTVAPAAASQVVATLEKTSVGQQQTLNVSCAQFDAFGNPRQFDFTAADVSTNPAAGSIVEVGTTNTFTIGGFTTFGIYEVTCDDGTRTDTETFNVGQQAGANSVLATANLAQIEASTGTITVTCQEVDGFGNPVAFDFVAGSGFTTTATGTVAEIGTTNSFTISNVTATGSFSATCTGSVSSAAENFAVVDSTAPTVSSFTFSGAAPFAAGTTVTVNFDVVDAIGVAAESIAVVSGPGEVVGSGVNFEPGIADPPSRQFQVLVKGNVGMASTVVVRGQVSDTTGNLRTTSDLSIAVNAAGTVTSITVSPATVEAGSATLTVTCNEVNAVTGSSANTNFANANVTTTETGELVNETTPTSNIFNVTNHAAKGTFTATCQGVGSSSAPASFTVVDTTAPSQDGFSVTGGLGPYPADTLVTVNLDVSDVIGVASESLSIVSGPGRIVSPATVFESGAANPPSRSFSVLLEGTIGSASTVVVRGQAADTTGNLFTTGDLSISVNAADTVVTVTADPATVEAGSTLVLVCEEAHEVTGADAGTAFDAADVSTTATGETIVEQIPAPNSFNVTGLVQTGTFTATCVGDNSSGDGDFTVVDTTPPTASTGVSPAGPTYNAGVSVDVTVTASDVVGLSNASLVVAGGNATITSASVKALGGATSSAPVFTVRLDGSTTGASTVSLIAQVTDTTGNVRQPAQIDLSVNQAATAVVATLAGSAIEHNQALQIACKQINAATGADTGVGFLTTDVTTTAPTSGPPTITSLGGNTFSISGPFTAKGSFTATCTKSAQSDVESFTIYDTTAPTIGTLSVVAATGPNGVTADNRYAPGTIVTVRLNTTADAIGLSRIDLAATGPSNVAPSSRFVSGTTATNQDFDVYISPSAPTFATIVATAQSSDTTGNTSAPSGSLTLTVDPGVSLVVAPLVTLRTLFEGSTLTGAPFAMGTDGTDLFLQRRDEATGFLQDVVKLTGSTAPATQSIAIGSGFPATPGTSFGITAGAFGGPGTIFHALTGGTPQIGTNTGTSHSRFDSITAPTLPNDLVITDLEGGAARLYTMDDAFGSPQILKSFPTGVTNLYLSEANLAGCTAVTRDASAIRLLLACPNQIRGVSDGGGVGLASVQLSASGPGSPMDIASVGTQVFIAGGASDQTVHRFNAFTAGTPISTAFAEPRAVVIKTGDSNSLNILDVDTLNETWRVYRVTGY